MTQGQMSGEKVARMKTDEGWTKRVNRDKTASSQQSDHPNSVQGNRIMIPLNLRR
jgi:hypothetical protein